MIDYDTVLNERIKRIKPSGIRRFFDLAVNMDHVISLSIGEPDFSTPWHIRQEAIKSLNEGKTWYSPNKGFKELLKEISIYFKRKFNVEYDYEKEILVTVGASEAIDLCLRVLINPEDEVLIPTPSFVCYEPLVEICGGKAININTKIENKFKLLPDEIERSITPKTKLLILPYPNNPTGAVMTRKELEEIAKVVKRHNIMVVSDEIYSELTYNNEKYTTFSNIDGMKERTIIINGFSKAYAMTGWRLGYALGPQKIISAMTKLHQFSIMSSPTISQYAAIEALKNGDEDIEKMKNEYNMRRRFLVNELNRIGLKCFEPNGAFYVFPSISSTGITSEEFSKRLLIEKKVAVIPGTAFGNDLEGFVRISYSYSLNHLKKALEKIKNFLTDLKL